MSVVENVAKHADDIESEIAKMHEAMAKSPTGIEMLEKSQAMGTSEEMMELMELLGDVDFPEDERVTLAGYMGEMLQKYPEDGLVKFAEYLEDLITKPEYKNRDGYYAVMADAARDLNESESYREYIAAYSAFNNDNSPEATEARKVSEETQKKMQKWSKG